MDMLTSYGHIIDRPVLIMWVILKSQNKITDFVMISAWASPFNLDVHACHFIVRPQCLLSESTHIKV